MIRTANSDSEIPSGWRARARAALIGLSVLVGCESTEPSPDAAATVYADASGLSSDDSPGTPLPDASPPLPDDGGLTGATRAGSWIHYGFDLKNSQVNPHETLLNAGNVAGLREKWRVQFPAGATSTPAVYAGNVYFGGWDGNAYAVDAQTGEIRWQRQVTSLIVRSTPLVTEDRVFIAAGADLLALDRADGTILFDTVLDAAQDTLIDSSPKLVDGLIVIGVSSIETGWPKDDYVNIGAVVALDAQTGVQVWRVATTGDGPGRCVGGAGASVWSTAAIDEDLGLLFIGTGQGHEAPASPCTDALLAIHYRRDHQGERVAWVAQYTADDTYAASFPAALTEPDSDVAAAPNLFEAAGQLLVGAGDKGASYRVFDRRTGEPKWRVDLDHGESTGVGGVMVTAAVHEGVIYVTSNHWAAALLGVSENALLGVEDTADYSTLYALDAATGKERWHKVLSQPMLGSFAIANGLLYHPTMFGMFYARELTTGAVAWSTDLKVNLGVGPSVVDGRVYVSAGFGMGSTTANPGVTDGFVASFGLGDGPGKVWEAEVEQPKPLTRAECQVAVENVSEWPAEGKPSSACSACLCECNATVVGHCGSCWLPASCAAQLCSLFEPEDLRTCMNYACTTKLLPATVFERALEAAPCATKCAEACGF